MKTQLITLACITVFVMGSFSAWAEATKPQGHRTLDTNNNGVIERSEVANFPRLAQQFDTLDKNKDGVLSADERPAMQPGRGHGNMHGGGMQKWLTELDTNGDKRISLSEAAKNERLAKNFDNMDVNRDGFLDAADRTLAMQQRRDEWFKKVDTNNDGMLSKEEVNAATAKRMEARQTRMEKQKNSQ